MDEFNLVPFDGFDDQVRGLPGSAPGRYHFPRQLKRQPICNEKSLLCTSRLSISSQVKYGSFAPKLDAPTEVITMGCKFQVSSAAITEIFKPGK